MAKPSKTKIAHLFHQLSYFVPEMDENRWTGRFLVNEKKVGFEAPGRDDLLHAIGEASLELRAFTHDHEKMKEQADISADVLKRVGEIVLSLIPLEEVDDVVQGLETIQGRYRQMIDFLHILQNNIPAEKMKDAVARFLEFKGHHLTVNLVNQNGQETTEANAGAGLALLPEAKNSTGLYCRHCGGKHFSTECPDPSGREPVQSIES